jgi:hypothetical protein
MFTPNDNLHFVRTYTKNVVISRRDWLLMRERHLTEGWEWQGIEKFKKIPMINMPWAEFDEFNPLHLRHQLNTEINKWIKTLSNFLEILLPATSLSSSPGLVLMRSAQVIQSCPSFHRLPFSVLSRQDGQIKIVCVSAVRHDVLLHVCVVKWAHN